MITIEGTAKKVKCPLCGNYTSSVHCIQKSTSKRRLNKIYKYVIQYVDLENNIEDSETLSILTTIAKIDEELTNIIYLIIDNRNS